MLKNNRKIKVFAINILVFLILYEITSVIIFFINHGAFFYTHQLSAAETLTMPQETMKFNRNNQLTDKRFHPFFGYTYGPNLGNCNNYGFNCTESMPLYKQSDKWFIIGIFGGSVAESFYLIGKDRFTQQLKRDPYFKDKEIHYLNFAMGGYKQPQQLLLLNYFLSRGQQLDMVLNIDGFNELMFCLGNNNMNIDIAMPSAQHMLPLSDLMNSNILNQDKLDCIFLIQKYKKKYTDSKSVMQSTPFASIYLIYSIYNKFVYSRYREELIHFDELTNSNTTPRSDDSIINIKHSQRIPNEKMLMADVLSLWYRTSLMMDHSVKGMNGQYFHFLQPNQYYSNKPFSSQEKENAVNNSLPYSYEIKKYYHLFESATQNLKNANVNVFSAVGIFNKETDTLYIDDCCHFNQKGNEILADFMAESILKSKVFQGKK